jgi:hypothetical protein
VELAKKLSSVEKSIDTIIFQDAPCAGQEPWNCSNGLIYSTPNNNIFLDCLDIICFNFKNSYYGRSPLSPTGPSVFGQALCSSHRDKNIIFGQYLALTPSHNQKNYAFVLPNGRIIAYGKKTHGITTGLKEFGVVNDEKSNYHKLWVDRNIYL